ncbi:hypothetical protein CYLTODRAFT_177698 [Cylindrobasidium torrendii FP15055 ss-10]|uniref:Uncharacterized protein n=1 Tax=Cylindrobasidium torrendii FP15055 ss-10 TaxID=1314674 RepID=A0A0D7AX37_9AGAR|nr:hypothetical protein CYLTODRAFT_177698 [Cylindrobasidium torrendii FP15055 ss-10]
MYNRSLTALMSPQDCVACPSCMISASSLVRTLSRSNSSQTFILLNIPSSRPQASTSDSTDLIDVARPAVPSVEVQHHIFERVFGITSQLLPNFTYAELIPSAKGLAELLLHIHKGRAANNKGRHLQPVIRCVCRFKLLSWLM